MAVFGGWRRAYEWSLSLFLGRECPYCIPVSRMRNASEGYYECRKCNSKFQLIDNELEAVVSSAPVAKSRPTCLLASKNPLSQSPLLCQNCEHHQNIILQLLSSFESSDSEKDVKRYREGLERRYPLCVGCRARIDERLRQLDYRLQSRLSKREQMADLKIKPHPNRELSLQIALQILLCFLFLRSIPIHGTFLKIGIVLATFYVAKDLRAYVMTALLALLRVALVNLSSSYAGYWPVVLLTVVVLSIHPTF